MTAADDAGVGRRALIYLHGFDPASTARYRRIFEAAAERLDVSVQDLPGGGEGWRVVRGGVVTDLHYLRYDTAVRAFRDRGPLARLGRGFRSIAGMALDGGLWRMAVRAPKALAIMVWPAVVTLVPLFAAALLAPQDPVEALLWIAAAAGLVALMVWRFMLLLISDAYAIERHLARSETMLWDDLQDELRMLLRSEPVASADEILLVGHSLGGIATLDLLADVLPDLPPDQRIGMLTMGSILNMILIQRGPGRRRIVQALHRVAADERVFWVDVSSPRDPFLPALVDPLLLAPPEGSEARSPRVIAAQLARVDAIPGDRRTVFPAMRRHMGYLLAAPEGAGFDYADTATGAETLEQRFGPRANSPRARMWRA